MSSNSAENLISETTADPLTHSRGPFQLRASPKCMNYTPEQRQKVVDFVNSHNSIHGRGGRSEAARRYNLNLLTIAAWLKKSRLSAMARITQHESIIESSPSNILEKVVEYMELGERIKNAEAEVTQLRARHESLAAQIRQSI